MNAADVEKKYKAARDVGVADERYVLLTRPDLSGLDLLLVTDFR